MATKKKPGATKRKVDRKPAAKRPAARTALSQGEAATGVDSSEPRLFTDEEMSRALEGWQERDAQRRAALDATEFDTLEGATIEWLLADSSPSSAKFRSRFGHGLLGVSDDDLLKVRALLRAIAEAARENDTGALKQVASYFDRFMSTDTRQAKLLRALELIDFASQRAEADPAIAVKLVLLLTGIDDRFGKPRTFSVASGESQKQLLSNVETTLKSIRHGTVRAKGGAHNIGPSTALAKLLVFTGALDASTDAASEKKKIENARVEQSKLRKPKKARKRV